MIHQEGHLAGIIATADAVHIPQFGTVHADQQIVFVVVAARQLPRCTTAAIDPVLCQLAPCRRIDRIADFFPAGRRRLDLKL